jgi:hypothetical protein
MSKFTKMSPAPAKSVIKTTTASSTFEGASGYSLDSKSELFLFAISNLVGETSFYESSEARDKRFRDLVHQVTQEDPAWVQRFIPYLRDTLNMRSASIVMAVEYVLAGGPSGRQVVSSAISRADEPADVIAYYRSRVGRSLPQPIKRGVADAATRVYNERSFLKYGSRSPYSFKDVLRITHPEPVATWQNDLFRFISLTSRKYLLVFLPYLPTSPSWAFLWKKEGRDSLTLRLWLMLV